MQCLSFSMQYVCHAFSETFLLSLNQRVAISLARYNCHCDHLVQMWLLSSQPYPLIMQRELAGRVVRMNPTKIL